MNLIRKLKKRLRLASRPEDDDAELTFTGETEPNYDRDPFLYSLCHLTPEDIRLSHEPHVPTRAERAADLARNVMLVICITVFAVSCVMLIDNLLQKEEGAALYDEAAAEFAAAGLDFGLSGTAAAAEQTGAMIRLRAAKSDSEARSLSAVHRGEEQDKTVAAEESPYKEQLEKLRATLRSYMSRNSDVYGYISIPAVGIEYVMVQGSDNDFYLDNNWLGEYLVIGSIFVDYRCEDTIADNRNTVIYGHNIATGGGSMFHGVEKFKNKNTFDTAQIYVYTMDGVYIYQPFSYYDTNASSGYIRTAFGTGEEFASFAAEMKGRSMHEAALTVGENDRIITLSTCTNITASGRYALHAVLVEAITG